MRVMLAITVGYAFAYTCRLALSIVKKPLIDAGIFSSHRSRSDRLGAPVLRTRFGKLVNGFLADHANIRVFFAFGVLVSALINVAMGFSTLLWVSVALWALNGWFQGFGAPSGVVSLAQWFGNRERGRFYGIWSTAHSIGEGLTFVAIGALVGWFGWRAGFWGPGLLCIAGRPSRSTLLLRDRPRTMGLPTVADWRDDHYAGSKARTTRHAASCCGSSSRCWRYRRSGCSRVSSALMYVTRYAINSWGVLYLQETRGYSLVEAGGVPDGEHARRHRRLRRFRLRLGQGSSTRGARRPTCSSR